MAKIVFIVPLITTAESPDLATPAPRRPPTRACELDEGMPPSQVMTFQAIAPVSAPRITWSLMIAGSMIPLPMVLATCVPNIAKAMKLKNAAHITA